jgi:prophage tail gpP-like protein
MTTPSDRYDGIGSGHDRVELKLVGETVLIARDGNIKTSVFSAPSVFTLTLGWGDTTRELLSLYPPRAPFELAIGDIRMMTGRVDAIQTGGEATEVTITGRDLTAVLVDDEVAEDQQFSESTYFQLTEKMLVACGIESFALSGDNTANRKAITGHDIVEVAKPMPGMSFEVTEQPPPTEEQQALTEKRRVYRTIKAEVGQTRWNFLERHYKKAGLFLWNAGDGQFVLARPNPAQKPSYLIQRRRGDTRETCNVLQHQFTNDFTGRRARTVVHGTTGGGKAGRGKVQAVLEDPECLALGMRNQRTIKDRDVKTQSQAAYVARREVAQQRRDGWRLEYTVSGLIVPSLIAPGSWAAWAPDTVCRVEDDELGLHGDFYVSDVDFRIAPRTTTIRLMRPEDLIFADEEDPSLVKHVSGNGKQLHRAEPPESGKPGEVDWAALIWKDAPKHYWWNRTRGAGFKPEPPPKEPGTPPSPTDEDLTLAQRAAFAGIRTY